MQIETDEGKEQRQRDGGGDDQAGAEIVEEENEDDHDQQHAAQQVLLHDLGGEGDQVGAVVVRMDFDILGQDDVIEFLGLGLDAFQDVLGFFAGAQEDDAFHGVVLLLVAEFTEARGDADDHAADIL